MLEQKKIEVDGYENVVSFEDKETGLRSIIAVHSTKLGPALGGCRLRPYLDFDEALEDVLSLAEAMSYKNALAGINFGGGKAVIITEPDFSEGREGVFQSFGKAVDSLAGKYVTAEDMGTTVADMSVISNQTSFVAGKDPAEGFAGDPSPYTSGGVYNGMKACIEHAYNKSSFAGLKVAIQGVGTTGYYLSKLLADAGAELYLSDIVADRVQEVADELGAEVVAENEIYGLNVDVFSPCAIGGVINPGTIDRLKARVIAGAANVQLSDSSMLDEISKRDIVYAPDFVINAGGVISVADEFEVGGFNEERVLKRVKKIYNTVSDVLSMATETNRHTADVALEMAQSIINQS